MPAKKHISTFTEISGFKRLIKCRGCGKTFFSQKSYIYCKKCSNKIKNK